MVFANYSNAFDTVRFSTALKRMHRLGFTGLFLKWMINYLSDPRHIVQIDDRRSDMADVVTYCRDKLDKMWLLAARRGTNSIKYSNPLKNTSLI